MQAGTFLLELYYKLFFTTHTQVVVVCASIYEAAKIVALSYTCSTGIYNVLTWDTLSANLDLVTAFNIQQT